MIVYKVYFKDYSLKKGRLLGVLSERRNDLRGESYFESGLRWARLTFGPFLKDKQSLFVVPQALEEGDATTRLMEKEIFSEREFLDVVRYYAPTGRVFFDTTVQKKEVMLPVQRTGLPGHGDTMIRTTLTPVVESVAALPVYPAQAERGGHSAEWPVSPPPKALFKDAHDTVAYDKFYAFSAKPFEGISDHNGIYLSPSHRAALTFMTDGIVNQVGYITVTGEAGTGKTALIAFLSTRLGKMVATVIISFPPPNVTELIKSVLLELDLETVNANEEGVRNQLHEYLLQACARHKGLVVVIDDAQDLSGELVDELGKLIEEEKQLQIIFVGRCEFEEKLQTQEGRKLWKGKGIKCRIRALNHKESKRYMDHRLRLVGSSLSTVFTPKAVSMIVGYAEGIPRLINILSTQAFLVGCDLGDRKIDVTVISEVIKEVKEGHLLGMLRHRYSA
jgi:general secretion pathway protein A